MILFEHVLNDDTFWRCFKWTNKPQKRSLLLTGSQIPRWLEARRWWRTSRERKRKKVDASRSRAFTGGSLKKIFAKNRKTKIDMETCFIAKFRQADFKHLFPGGQVSPRQLFLTSNTWQGETSELIRTLWLISAGQNIAHRYAIFLCSLDVNLIRQLIGQNTKLFCVLTRDTSVYWQVWTFLY